MVQPFEDLDLRERFVLSVGGFSWFRHDDRNPHFDTSPSNQHSALVRLSGGTGSGTRSHPVPQTTLSRTVQHNSADTIAQDNTHTPNKKKANSNLHFPKFAGLRDRRCHIRYPNRHKLILAPHHAMSAPDLTEQRRYGAWSLHLFAMKNQEWRPTPIHHPHHTSPHPFIPRPRSIRHLSSRRAVRHFLLRTLPVLIFPRSSEPHRQREPCTAGHHTPELLPSLMPRQRMSDLDLVYPIARAQREIRDKQPHA